ncbi:transporter substrate-binding domain-containing protein [Trichothermofontia sp.]
MVRQSSHSWKLVCQQFVAQCMRTTLTVFALATVTAAPAMAQLDSGVGPARASGSPGSDRGTLTLGTATNYPPFEYRDERLNAHEIVGFDIAIARYIAQRLGYRITLRDMSFNELIPALQADQLDWAMAAITPTPERLEKVAFSDVYFESQNTIVSRQEQPLTQTADLAGKRVGVQLGSIQAAYAQKLATAMPVTLISHQRISELIQALRQAELDAAIIEDKIAEVYLEDDPTLMVSIIPNVEPMGSAIAFPKTSELVDEVNRVLQEMRENGELDRLIRQWFALQ